MKHSSVLLIVILSLLVAGCSAPPSQPTPLPPVTAATATSAPIATQPAPQSTLPLAATATQAASQPTATPSATATQAANTSGKPAVPAAYASKTNPLAGNAGAISAGKTVYADNCADCHGNNAGGSSRGANLLQTVKEASEAYLFWRVSEGGRMAPFNSRMPSFKDRLTENQIWQVITYLQSLK